MKLKKSTGWLEIEEGLRHSKSPHFNARPEGVAVDMVVIHNISLPEGEFGASYIEQLFKGNLDCSAFPAFKNIDTRVSAHIVIDRQGLITQYVSFNDRAWHAGKSHFDGRDNCNDFSIGIELEGSDHVPFETIQYNKLNELLKVIVMRYPLITLERIVGHEDIAPGRKTDPGPFFEWKRVTIA